MLPFHDLEDPVIVQKKQDCCERHARSSGYDGDFRRDRISATLLRVHIAQRGDQSGYGVERYDSDKKESVNIISLGFLGLSII